MLLMTYSFYLAFCFPSPYPSNTIDNLWLLLHVEYENTVVWKTVSGSGSVSVWASRIRIRNYFYGSASDTSTTNKIIEKNLDFNCYVTSYWLPESNKQKNLLKTLIFCWHLESHCRKEKYPLSSVRIQGSGSVSKCHGNGTLDRYTLSWWAWYVYSVKRVLHCLTPGSSLF